MKLLLGDCLELLKTIPDGSIDMVLTDPPYGTTACKWDNLIDFAAMWVQVRRVIKENGAILLFGAEPFSSRLRLSLIKEFKYDWIFEKTNSTGFLNARRMPLKNYEIISVFSKRQTPYFPQFTEGKPYTAKMGRRGASTTADKKIQAGGHVTKSDGRRFPKQIIKFKNSEKGLHPTQKPVPLLEYLIKTYTLDGETVLDFTMGSGSTGVACKNTGRDFIGIELDEKYFEIAKQRIADSKGEPK
jgi:site-specific DNA-methyltransferase (adenine-specific)